MQGISRAGRVFSRSACRGGSCRADGASAFFCRCAPCRGGPCRADGASAFFCRCAPVVSRPCPSLARASSCRCGHVGMLFLPCWQERKKRMLLHPLCGERGIRTPVPLLATTRFPGVPLKPLEHLSSVKWSANILINFHLHQNL